MNGDTTERTLASLLLHGLACGYEEVLATHLRRREVQSGALDFEELWEVEVETTLGIAMTLCGECPFDTATAVVGEIVEMVEAERARVAVRLN